MHRQKRWRRFGASLLLVVFLVVTKEYIITLQNRPKWGTVKEEMYEGQMVLVADPDAPRTHWNLARIEEKLPSTDNITRRYMVKMPNGHILERHHNVLVPLELEYQDEKEENVSL